MFSVVETAPRKNMSHVVESRSRFCSENKVNDTGVNKIYHVDVFGGVSSKIQFSFRPANKYTDNKFLCWWFVKVNNNKEDSDQKSREIVVERVLGVY